MASYVTKVFIILKIALVSANLAGCLSEGNVDDSSSSLSALGNDNINGPPRISGSPQTIIKIGDTYTFTPTASDPDSDELSFSIENRPRWADFNSETGHLSGPVLPGDQGVYANIQISVTDGETRVFLPAFAVTVTDSAIGSMSLRWMVPTENSDGSALTDLAGYTVHYGTESQSYSHHIPISNPSIDFYVIENLVADTYYVTITAFNQRGTESDFSNEVIKTISAE